MSPKQPPPRKKKPVPAAKGAAATKSIPVFWVGVGVVIAIAVTVGIVSRVGGSDSRKPAGGGSSGTASSHEFGPVTVTGIPLAQFPDRGTDPAVGKTIPTVSGRNFAGAPVTIAPNGHAQMIVFLAHWCPHCNREAPKLAASLQANGGAPAGVDLTIVPTGSRSDAPMWPPSQWVRDMKLGAVTTLVDSQKQQAAAAFGLASYPYIVTVDKDGKVLDRRAGEQQDGFFDRAFKALADGTAIPKS